MKVLIGFATGLGSSAVLSGELGQHRRGSLTSIYFAWRCARFRSTWNGSVAERFEEWWQVAAECVRGGVWPEGLSLTKSIGEDVLTGIHHLALTVTDVERSAAWYSELLGMVHVIGDDTDDVRFRVLAHPDSGMVIGLRQYPMAGSGDAFDEMRTGMDHVAIGVESADELTAWEVRLDELGITYTPAAETPIGTVIVLRDPDNIQLEFWLPAG